MNNKYCPICGEENNCLKESEEQITCWCHYEGRFPNGIFNLVPEESRGKRCICKNCVNRLKEEEKIK